jgi:hypothetical protein
VAARTFLYVDGFNLYHRALKDSPYKWLDLRLLARQVLLPHNQVTCIKYFTARVSGQRDPSSPARQAAYLKALSTLPEVEIFFGHFLAKTITRPLVRPIRGLPKFVEVHTSEEKGSDVNLAVQLLNDAWAQKFDVAAVISNDSDLESPIEIVRTQRNLPVGVLCPHEGFPSPQLKGAASFLRHIRQQHLAASQFPSSMVGADGKPIVKPSGW